MYWYNPTLRNSERIEAPRTDEEAIEMLTGDPDSATFVSEYARLRVSGMGVEQALIMVGHEGRIRHLVEAAQNAFRPSAIGYELLVGTATSSRR